jgi:hypothetical protein
MLDETAFVVVVLHSLAPLLSNGMPARSTLEQRGCRVRSCAASVAHCPSNTTIAHTAAMRSVHRWK